MGHNILVSHQATLHLAQNDSNRGLNSWYIMRHRILECFHIFVARSIGWYQKFWKRSSLLVQGRPTNLPVDLAGQYPFSWLKTELPDYFTYFSWIKTYFMKWDSIGEPLWNKAFFVWLGQTALYQSTQKIVVPLSS